MMRLKNLLYLLIEWLLGTGTDKIVCISAAEKKSALQHKIVKDKKLILIPSGIDIDAVRGAVPIERAAIGMSEDDYIVGVIGRFVPQKAPDIFIRAALLIKQEIPHAAFVFLGDGELKEETEQYALQYGIRLVAPGWVDNPYAYLKTFDVALALPRWEGFGLAIAEYMAAEKNIVATRVDAIPTLIEDGKDGLLVNVDSPEEVRDKVVYIYRHPEEAAEMRKNALEKVKREFDIKRVAKQHCQLFKELISK